MKNFKACFIVCFILFSLLTSCKKGECENNSDCDDGLYCNGSERCLKGKCATSNILPCDDGLPCTTDICDEEKKECHHQAPDYDGDGFTQKGCLSDGDDCNDFNSEIHPGAEELCDGIDNDCDGVINEDKDRDGHFSFQICPEGDDCDDSNPLVYPMAPEPCDGIDNNCKDGTADEADTDGDGFIDSTCGGNDCDDENPNINPSTTEICNGKDDNCDGKVDETFECAQGVLYDCQTTCGTTGKSKCGQDCKRGVCQPPDEICNGIDDNCNGQADENLPCREGEPVSCETKCGSTGLGLCTPQCRPPGPDDCTPPSQEECNQKDDDCDGEIDEGFPCHPGEMTFCITTCNSYGTGKCTSDCNIPPPDSCEPPEEICFNGKDDNCDGDIDEFCF